MGLGRRVKKKNWYDKLFDIIYGQPMPHRDKYEVVRECRGQKFTFKVILFGNWKMGPGRSRHLEHSIFMKTVDIGYDPKEVVMNWHTNLHPYYDTSIPNGGHFDTAFDKLMSDYFADKEREAEKREKFVSAKQAAGNTLISMGAVKLHI